MVQVASCGDESLKKDAETLIMDAKVYETDPGCMLILNHPDHATALGEVMSQSWPTNPNPNPNFEI